MHGSEYHHTYTSKLHSIQSSNVPFSPCTHDLYKTGRVYCIVVELHLQIISHNFFHSFSINLQQESLSYSTTYILDSPNWSNWSSQSN